MLESEPIFESCNFISDIYMLCFVCFSVIVDVTNLDWFVQKLYSLG